MRGDMPMDEIKLLTGSDMKGYVEIVADAFPMINLNTPEEREKFRQNIIKSIEAGFSAGAYGYFKDSELIGGTRLFDFPMNLFGHKILLGGLGLVAVHLAHKKEKVASQMIQYYFNHYDAKGVFLLGLYPFRPDFYKKMGFGFGGKAKQYQISPAKLPGGQSKKSIRLLTIDDKRLILDYTQQYMEKRHGFIQLSEFELEHFFEENKKIVGFEKNGRLEGYMTFFFQFDPREKYNIHVTGLFYNGREVLSELLYFLHSQADQVEKIIIDSHEEYFHFLTDNPSNGERAIFLHHQTNVEELGIMYRVINNRRLFESLSGHNFGGVTLALKLDIHDSYFPKNNESLIIQFENGKPKPAETDNYQVEIEMDIAEFSSMVMGVIPFSQLYQYSKAEISHREFLPVIDKLFFTGEKPVCYTRF
jgi:predicted acetyltransferase